MMTLSEANDLITPIIKSEIFKTSVRLIGKAAEIRKMFEGFEHKGPFKLNQFEILDDDKESAFREMIAIYKEEESGQKEVQNVDKRTNI